MDSDTAKMCSGSDSSNSSFNADFLWPNFSIILSDSPAHIFAAQNHFPITESTARKTGNSTLKGSCLKEAYVLLQPVTVID